MSAPNDLAQRREALDTQRSFIVQAPAGSGKTGLLTQRFLALLGHAGSPESIVAMTFTRKAAAEMRERVLLALRAAQHDAPESAYEKQTWELARTALERDQAEGWNIVLNPARLRIVTIDSLCHQLVAQMPVLSSLGAPPVVADYPQQLYLRAVDRLLSSLGGRRDLPGSLETVLTRLDNNLDRTRTLLTGMLATREHWLPLVMSSDEDELSRKHLEKTFARSIERALARAAAALPSDLAEELVELAGHGAGHCPGDHPLARCVRMDALPEPRVEHFDLWMGLRACLLTKGGELRKQATADLGFAAPSATKDSGEKQQRKAWKERFKALLAAFRERPGVEAAFAALGTLPRPGYTHEEWQLLNALQSLLPDAVAHLHLVFQEAGALDYSEVTQRALRALGEDEAPSDLALRLDYRISHLLVDEFQDTSRVQYALLQRLVAGWMPDDGRTFFAVGDPMQSIYRFRDADVGLFLHARAHGIGDVPLVPLTLTANFRSDPRLVSFANDTFAKIFPALESIAEAAVSFVPAHAEVAAMDEAVVRLHAVAEDGGGAEAQQVIAAVIEAREKLEKPTIGVIVRTRSALRTVLPALRAAGLDYQAVEIEDLAEQPVVQDLWSLTRALLHLEDRAAWLAILRAPWCGLTLEDLFAISRGKTSLSIWERMVAVSSDTALTADGRRRLARIKGVLASALSERGRKDLRAWVEGTWAALGGPACVRSPVELDHARDYLDALERFACDGGFDDAVELERVVSALKAKASPHADASLQVMTIHKAKGLEFDCVILPGLQQGSQGDTKQLLNTLERTDDSGRRELLIAPLDPYGDEDPIGDYVLAERRRRAEHEHLRLLYVAVTRARRRLHLVTALKAGDDGDWKPPAAGSLAGRLWPACGEAFLAAVPDAPSPAVAEPVAAPRLIRRLPADWMPPPTPQPKGWSGTDAGEYGSRAAAAPDAGSTARHIGTAVHRVLQRVAEEGIDAWMGRWIHDLDPYLCRMLLSLGVPETGLGEAAARAAAAVRSSLQDERGRWVLGTHRRARSEMPLSGWLDGRLYSVVLDRTFLDEQGARWIIDFKTAAGGGGDHEAFLDAEQERYRGQLQLYGRLLQRTETTNIMLALYFPRFQGWRQWRFDPAGGRDE